MDAGFRLAKASTARRFVLSLELAWWLLDPTLSGKPDIRFRGCWPHKGLAEETGYPLIWLNIHPPKFHEQEDHLLGRKADNFEQTLRELCENFILEFGVPSHVPFLHGDEAGDPPSLEFSAQLEDAKELLRKILFVEEGEAGDPCLEIADDLGQALQSKLRNLGTEPLRE